MRKIRKVLVKLLQKLAGGGAEPCNTDKESYNNIFISARRVALLF